MLFHSVILTAAIATLLARNVVVKHLKIFFGAALIIVGNLLSLNFIIARVSSTDGVQTNFTVNDTEVFAEICIAALLRHLFDARTTGGFFVPTALAGVAPAIGVYGL